MTRKGWFSFSFLSTRFYIWLCVDCFSFLFSQSPVKNRRYYKSAFWLHGKKGGGASKKLVFEKKISRHCMQPGVLDSLVIFPRHMSWSKNATRFVWSMTSIKIFRFTKKMSVCSDLHIESHLSIRRFWPVCSTVFVSYLILFIIRFHKHSKSGNRASSDEVKDEQRQQMVLKRIPFFLLLWTKISRYEFESLSIDVVKHKNTISQKFENFSVSVWRMLTYLVLRSIQLANKWIRFKGKFAIYIHPHILR
jgi:hypothetical protein